MFGGVGDGVTNCDNAFACAVSSGAKSIKVENGKSYLITDPITITTDGFTLYADTPVNTEGPANGAEILYDGDDAGYMIVVGSTGAATATSPVIIKNLYLNGQNKTLYGIWLNRTNYLSTVERCYLRNTNGYIRADSAWAAKIRDNFFRGDLNNGVVALSAAFAELHNGSVQFNAANSAEYTGNTISTHQITIDGSAQEFLFYSNRQENLLFQQNTMEEVHVEKGLVAAGETSRGHNFQISHWYIEKASAEAPFYGHTYIQGNVDFDFVHILASHFDYFIKSGSSNVRPSYSLKRVNFYDRVSIGALAYGGDNQTNVTVEDCRLIPGYSTYDTDHYVIRPYGGETVTVGEYTYTTNDNRLGLAMATTALDRASSNYLPSYISAGFATTYTGLETVGEYIGDPYIDLAYNGTGIVLNGKSHFLSQKYTNDYRIRFYPTKNADTRLWQIRLGRHGNLFLYDTTSGTITNNATSIPVLAFNMAADDTVNAATIDTTVRRPPGLYSDYNRNCVIFYTTTDPSLALGSYTYIQGDTWMKYNSYSYSIKGRRCIAGGNPGTWQAFGPATGTTAQRPTTSLGVNDAGFSYYDTTLSSEIVWNGTGWAGATGVPGTSTVNTEAELIAAKDAAGTVIVGSDITLTAPISISATITHVPGAIITTNGNIITFATNAYLIYNGEQMFASSPGEVVGLSYVTPEMFGGACDSTGAAGNGTDSLNAFDCALASLTKTGVIELDAQFSTYYRISDTWDIRNTTLNSGHRVVIRGPKDSNRNARIYLDNDTATYALYYSGSGHKINIHDVIIMSTYNYGAYTSGGTTFHPASGIYVDGLTESEFENVSISGFDTGFYGNNTYKLKYYGGQIAKCRKGMNLEGIQYSTDVEQVAFSYCGDNGTPANGYSLRNYWGGNTSIKRCRFEHSWQSLGIILEKAQGAEVANNNFETFTVSRSIKLMGSSTESLSSKRNWTTGFSIHDNRFWNSYGITVHDGVGWGTIDNNTWLNSLPESAQLEADTTTAILTTGVTDWNTLRNIRYGKGNSWLHGIAPTLHNTAGRIHAFNYDGYRRSTVIPTTGTFERGEAIENTNSTGMFWVCQKAGTAGSLAGVTGTIADVTTEDSQIVLNTLTGIFPGAQVTIAGAGATGVNLEVTIGGVDPDTNTAYFYPVASTNVAAAAVTFTAPVFMPTGVNSYLQSMAYAASVAPDLSLGGVVSIGELTGNVEIANPINILNGERFVVLLRADGTARNITYGANFRAGAPASIAASQYLALEFMQAATGAGGIRFVGTVGLPAASVGDVNTGTSTTTAITPGALAGSNLGTKTIQLTTTGDTATLIVGDVSEPFTIPSEMNGWQLVSASAQVGTVSSSGLPTFKIEKFRLSAAGTRDAAVQMLSTNLTVDENEYDSKDATTPAVISAVAGVKVLATGDRIKAECTVAGTGTKGGTVNLGFRLP